MTWGGAWSTLRKSWKQFKFALRESDGEKIDVRTAMDLPDTEVE